MIKNMTLKEFAAANKIKDGEANSALKTFERLGIATNTGIRKEGKGVSKGQGKRPSEYAIASSCTVSISDKGVMSANIPESEVYQAPEAEAKASKSSKNAKTSQETSEA